MQETIACPECRRRLVLPEREVENVVQCPSCGARFRPGPGRRDRDDPSPSRHRLPATGPEVPWAEEARPEEASPADEILSRVRRVPTRPRGPWKIFWTWAGALALLVGVGSLLVFVSIPSLTTSRPSVVEDDEERREEIRAAFAAQNPAGEAEREELKRLFVALGAAFRAGDGERITAFFDLDRMSEEFVGLLPPSQRSARNRNDFARGLRQGWARSMSQKAEIFAWNDFEIRGVKKLAEDEAVAIVRHDTVKNVTAKMRWWVVRRDGAWKVYDLEDLDLGMRSSTTMASLMAGGGADLAGVAPAVKDVTDALQTLAFEEDVDGAERKLRRADGVRLPKALDGLRWMVEGSLRLRRGKPDEALEALGKASALHPDMPILDLLRGMAYNQLGKWAEALKHLEAYRELLGEDAIVCAQIGNALHGQEKYAEAATALRKSLDMDPKDAEVFLSFLHVIGDDAAKDVGPRFAKLATPREHFEQLAEDCEQRKVYDMLEAIARAMRKIDPRFAPADYYLALGEARAGRSAEAAKLCAAAVAGQQDAAKRQTYEAGFLAAMAVGGKYADAYAAAPTRDAFRTLAAGAMKSYRRDELKRLVELHEKKDADDPLLPAYRGQVLVDQGLYEAADVQFAKAAANPDKDALAPFRAGRVEARYRTGKALSAYREIGPRDETFLQLVTLAYYANEDDRLRELLDAHAIKEPDSLELARFRLRLRVRQMKTPEAVALFKKLLARRLPDERRGQLVSEFLTDMTAAGAVVAGYEAAPDAEKAFTEVAEELKDESQFDDLRALIAAHRAARPDDVALSFYQGEILSSEEAWAEAEKVFREALKKAPEADRERYRDRFVYAAYKNGHAREAYAEAGPRDKTFVQLAYLMSADKKGADLEALLAAHRPHAKETEGPTLLVFEMEAKIFAKKPAEALPLFQKALKGETQDFARKRCADRYLIAMASIGQPVEAYRAAPDKSAALETLASSLESQKKDADLEALLEEHAKGHADDPLLPFFRGELFMLRGDPKQAEPFYAAAFAKRTPPTLWRFRTGLFRVRVKLGRAVATYREVEPGSATFASLAYECQAAKDAKQLRALIDAHRAADPKDDGLPLWELEYQWLNRDYEGALKRIAGHREAFVQAGAHFKVEGYHVRALVRLKRPAEAVREAERLRGQPILRLLAHAAAGDVEKTTELLEQMRPTPYFLRSCYDDEDLGPILRGDAFEELREEYPRPADRK